MSENVENEKLNIKEAIFNKFYLEFIIFFIILFLGTTINLLIYKSVEAEEVAIVSSLIVMIITLVALYSFGFIIAQKRIGLNKYFPSIFFLVVFLVIWILSAIFNNSQNYVGNFLANINNMILSIHNLIFNSINMIFSTSIPSRIFTFVTPFIVYLGNRKSRTREIAKIKREKMLRIREESNGDTNN